MKFHLKQILIAFAVLAIFISSGLYFFELGREVENKAKVLTGQAKINDAIARNPGAFLNRHPSEKKSQP